MSNEKSKDKSKEKVQRKKYTPPAIESEPVFATVATGCSKESTANPHCTVRAGFHS